MRTRLKQSEHPGSKGAPHSISYREWKRYVFLPDWLMTVTSDGGARELNQLVVRVRRFLADIEEETQADIGWILGVDNQPPNPRIRVVLFEVMSLSREEWSANADRRFANASISLYEGHHRGARFIASAGAHEDENLQCGGRLAKWITERESGDVAVKRPSSRIYTAGIGTSRVGGRSAIAFIDARDARKVVMRISDRRQKEAECLAMLAAIKRCPRTSDVTIRSSSQFLCTHFNGSKQTKSSVIQGILTCIREVIQERDLTVMLSYIPSDENPARRLLELSRCVGVDE